MPTAIDECANLALAALSKDVRTRFAADPFGTLSGPLGIHVRAVDHLDYSRLDGAGCDGISYLNDGVILYRQTGNRRENFTLAHELGHYLVDSTDAIYDILARFDDAALLLETVCDRIARLLLLPEAAVAAVLGGESVEAKHVMAIYNATNASVQACSIALKDHLPALGAVVVIDRGAQEVRSASIRPDDDHGWPTVYPWPGQPIPAGHPLRRLQNKQTLRQRTYWTTPWGKREDFYVDAVAYPTAIVAVFSAIDLWEAERFHPSVERDFDRRPKLTVRCCGKTHQVRTWPCGECGEGRCPSCDRCRCDRQAAAEVLCAGSCFLKFKPHLLVNGLCEECR